MMKTLAWTTAAGVLACGLLVGCDWPASPPKAADHKVPTTLAVVPGNQAEVAAVTAAGTARVNYRYRLVVLQSYYEKTGNMDKRRWTRREIKNLDKARTFSWEGVPEIVPPKGESLVNTDEHILVEYVVGARRKYLKAMGDLLAYYKKNDPTSYKLQRVANELERFDPVRTYMYFLEAEIPGPDLRPVEVIPQADKMFDQAVSLHAHLRHHGLPQAASGPSDSPGPGSQVPAKHEGRPGGVLHRGDLQGVLQRGHPSRPLVRAGLAVGSQHHEAGPLPGRHRPRPSAAQPRQGDRALPPGHHPRAVQRQQRPLRPQPDPRPDRLLRAEARAFSFAFRKRLVHQQVILIGAGAVRTCRIRSDGEAMCASRPKQGPGPEVGKCLSTGSRQSVGCWSV
jgi:hypothetical protein